MKGLANAGLTLTFTQANLVSYSIKLNDNNAISFTEYGFECSTQLCKPFQLFVTLFCYKNIYAIKACGYRNMTTNMQDNTHHSVSGADKARYS